MIEYCNCEAGFGLPHSHLREWHVVRTDAPTTVVVTPGDGRDTGWVRVWVDWKKIARLLLTDGRDGG